jgi:AcrR family transcriptional regulator
MPTKAEQRASTEARIVAAVGELLAEKGFGAVGVNAVAKRSGCNKALIYRYFGGLDGVFRAYAEGEAFWPDLAELAAGTHDLTEEADLWKRVMRNYTSALRKRPLTVEILAWETMERNELTAVLEEIRERRGLELLEHFAGGDPAVAALLGAAVHYLLVRARKIRIYNGIDLQTDEGWEALLTAMDRLIDGLA